MTHNLLLTLIAVPIASGLVLLCLPDRVRVVTKFLAFLVTLSALAGGICAFIQKPLAWEYSAVTYLRADNLSAFIGMVVCLSAFLITIYSIGFTKRLYGRYFGLLLMTLGASLGVLYANNLIVMVVFWGFLAAMLYLLVNLEGTDASTRSSRKALIIIGGTDAVMILGIALIWIISGTMSMDRVHMPLSGSLAVVAYFSLVIASLAKAGAVPFHSWLPDVAEDASVPVAAYLPASLDKLLGIYLLTRASHDLFITTRASNLVLLIVGAVTIIMAVMMALVQHNYKRLLGYHAVSQVGYMIIGIGSGTVIGLAGGLFHMLNNAIYKSCLFFTAGAVEKEAGTTDLDKLGALAKFMPLTFAACVVAALSISGIPPFNGFVSKWMIYQGIIESASSGDKFWVIWLSAAMFGSALTIASFMKLLHAAFLGRSSRSGESIREVGPFMYVPMLVLSGLCVILGVLAFKIPIPLFLIPYLGSNPVYIGMWPVIPAAILMLAGLSLGILMYRILLPAGGFRTVDNFVGGEDPETLPAPSGTAFYDTIKDIKPIGRICEAESSGRLDLYNIVTKALDYLSRGLGYLHNGVLPTYLIWSLLGMAGIFALLLF